MLVLVDVEALLGNPDEPAEMHEGQWHTSVAALAGVVLLCGFAYVYMESQLKASDEPLYIQQHQLSFFGMATAFWLYIVHRLSPKAHPQIPHPVAGEASSGAF